jgi:hypothetical protein
MRTHCSYIKVLRDYFWYDDQYNLGLDIATAKINQTEVGLRTLTSLNDYLCADVWSASSPYQCF